MNERLSNILLIFKVAPLMLTNGASRRLLAEMFEFVRSLPERMQQPLPAMMNDISCSVTDYGSFTELQVRNLADLASVLEKRSVPGICLKRSLTRYQFLQPFGLSLEVIFGAKLLKDGAEKRGLTGHAWLLQQGEPYFEAAENYTNFTPIYRWPPQASAPQTQSLTNADLADSGI